MAPRGKFKLNRKTVGAILRGADRGLKEAVHDAAEEMKDKAGPGATVEDYRTDRVVSGIVVGAADQARNGTASKAAQQVAANRKNRPFKSRAEWRRAFAAGDPNASARAHSTRGWAGLPEKAPHA